MTGNILNTTALMFGTVLNALGILLGGIAGLTVTRQLSPAKQSMLKVGMGAFTVFLGLKMTLLSLDGSFGHRVKQLVVVVLALILGKLAGRSLHLQKSSNRLGHFAKEKLSQARPGNPERFSNGLITCAILFCVGPIAFLGALADGLESNWKILAVKALMDGLAMMTFVKVFGWGAMLSVISVVAYQGTITLCVHALEPFLRQHDLAAPITATAGLLIFCIALIILELKKIELADYLPSLIFAPLLTLLVR